MFRFKAKHAKIANFSHVYFWFRMVLRRLCKPNCGILTFFGLIFA
jgi:hypothetical protein